MLIVRESAPVRQQTVSKLRDAICNGHFKPGDRLIERELCQLLGVSRTPIREALRQLEAEGLVKVLPNKGPIVDSLNIEQAKAVYQVRQVMESLACRLFATHADDSQIAVLTDSVDSFERAAVSGDIRALVQAKRDFYDILLEGCGNKLVQSILTSLLARISLLRMTSMSQMGRPLRSLAEIRAILDAISRRDGDAAWERSFAHIEQSEAVALEVLGKLKECGKESDNPDITEGKGKRHRQNG